MRRTAAVPPPPPTPCLAWPGRRGSTSSGCWRPTLTRTIFQPGIICGRQLGAPIGVGARIVEVQRTFAGRFGLTVPGPEVFDRLFADGDRFALGGLEVEVLHTPGHTPACVSYRIGDAVFVGDTLFMPDFGTARADFPGGDAVSLYRSIQRLLALPEETRIFVGHDYLPKDGRGDFRWETTVGAEQEGNIHVGGEATEADFTAMRSARDATLPPPKLLEPALRANIRAGATG